jgi:filamentous hemagglutinin family protein
MVVGKKLCLGLVIGGAIAFWGTSAVAQIIPDNTLPSSSVVTPSDNASAISGGTQIGDNLFHSFSEFSPLSGSDIFFNNSPDVQNIFARVTDESISNIDGLVRTNGTANLFLLNPNGINFGSNAALDIGGSFLATTANSLGFADNTEFSAAPTGSISLLNIGAPTSLRYGENPGSLNLSDNGLEVPLGKTLALVGGDVNLDGSTLRASDGRIELGAVAGVGTVGVNQGENLSLNFPNAPLGNISLRNGALVDASGEGGGDVQVTGENIVIADSSQIRSVASGEEITGTITIDAAGQVSLTNSSELGGGNIQITTSVLEVNNSFIDTPGSVTIIADVITFKGESRVVSVPEPSSLSGILFFTALTAASAFRRSQKNRQRLVN